MINRQQQKIVSAFLALLMFVLPFNSLAMQIALTDSQPGHCHNLESDLQTLHFETLDYAQCMMETCSENCSNSRHCSIQAPILLTLHDAQVHFGGHGFAIEPVHDTHLFIHPSGLYRPPRA